MAGYRKLWWLLIGILAITFSVLGYFGAEVYRSAPPIPAQVVDQQAPRHRGQVGAWLAQGGQVARRRGEQADEGVLRQVGRVAGIAKSAAQPALQPAMVAGIEGGDFAVQGAGGGAGGWGGWHGRTRWLEGGMHHQTRIILKSL